MHIVDQTSLQSNDEVQAKVLWDKMFDALFDRIRYKTLTIEEARHVIDEVILLLRAAKGRERPWNSVIEIVAIILKRDVSTKEIMQICMYARSTVYRSLNRLKSVGFIVTKKDEDVWTVNRDKFPILFYASRF